MTNTYELHDMNDSFPAEAKEVAKELLKKYKIFKPWRAKLGKDYWFVSINSIYRSTEDNTETDDYLYFTGNYYQTEKKASQAYQANLIIEAKNRLNFKMLELNNGWTPDWKDFYQGKYYPYCDYSTELPKVSYDYHNCQFGDYYFYSEEMAYQFVWEMKKDLNLVINIK